MTIANFSTESADHKSDFAEAIALPASILGLRPRIQDMRNGTFQPIVLIDDGANGAACFGEPRPTMREASDAARVACEAALPAGVWRNGWRAA